MATARLLRRYWPVAVLPIAISIGTVLYVAFMPDRGQRAFRAIKPGMTKSEITAATAIEPGMGPRRTVLDIPEKWGDRNLGNTLEFWCIDDWEIWVHFDSNGLAVAGELIRLASRRRPIRAVINEWVLD